MQNQGNPNHYPAGSEKGGQFAPRGTNLSVMENGRPKRKQLENTYESGDYYAHCVDEIVKETGMSVPNAIKFNNNLQKYFMGEEELTPGEMGEISDGLAQMAIYDGTIFRGMGFNSDPSEQANLKEALLRYGTVGNLVGETVLRSWTSDGHMACDLRFGKLESKAHDTIILKCKNNQSGVGVQHLSDYDEKEVLCPNKVLYRVKSVIVKNKLEGISDELAKKLGSRKLYLIEVEEI